MKRIRQQQAHDTVDADLMAKLESRDATLSSETHSLLCFISHLLTEQALVCPA